MFFGRNNDIDDDTFETKNNDKKKTNLKLPLIILGSVILLIVAIFLINKLMNKEEIAYEERLYYINLLGNKEITLYVGDEYVEPGYTGTDDIGNNLTKEVVISNNIENDKAGNYKVSYTLGNITKERNVKVIEKPVGATYIYLYGDVNVFLYVGDVYEEKNCEVIDTIEGSKLKDKVVITSNVDTSKEGIYKVIYSVVNSSGVTVSKERTVIVTSRDISLLPNNTNITNGNVTINIYVKDELFDYLILPDNKKLTERIWAYEVSNNGTYTFTMYNTKGEKTEKKVIINNIDREDPTGSCTGSYGNGISQINIKANDNIGISKYVLNGVSYTTNSIKIDEKIENADITIYDKAGNSKNINCKLENKNSSSSSSSSKPSSSSTKNLSSKSPSSSTKNSSSKSPSSSQSSIAPSTSSKPVIKKIDTTDLGCSFYYSNHVPLTYIFSAESVADELHTALKGACSFANSVSWLDGIQYGGAYADRPVSKYDYHSRGLAIDINNLWSYTHNGKTYHPYSDMGSYDWNVYQEFICDVCNGKEDCKYNVNYIIFKNYFSKIGWCWGGFFQGTENFDPMHYHRGDSGCPRWLTRTFNCN